jgi:hypothetical protein
MRPRLVTVATLVVLTGCSSGVKLKDAKLPKGGNLLPTTSSDILVFSNDDTYKFTPEFWLGSAGIIRQKDGSCVDIASAKFEWSEFTVRNDPTAGTTGSGGGSVPLPAPVINTVDDFATTLGYPLSPKRTEPELRAQSIVTQTIAANTSALSFFSADLSEDTVAEIALTDIAVQRAKPSKEFDDALAAFKTAHASDLVNASDVCYVFVVAGYTEKTLLRKYHTKQTAKSSGGYSGISVNGSYFASDQDYKMDYIFGLSVRVFKRPSGAPPTAEPPSKKDAVDIQQKMNERAKPPQPAEKLQKLRMLLRLR